MRPRLEVIDGKKPEPTVETLKIGQTSIELTAADVAQLQAEEARWRAEGRALYGQIVGKKSSPVQSSRVTSTTWTLILVMDRLQNAYSTLARLPVNIRPRAWANAWPKYAYDRGDRNAQQESGELEKLMAEHNRVRIPPTSKEISCMEEALNWPLRYLRDHPELARAVQLAALWESRKLDTSKQLKKCGLDGKEFGRRRMAGLRIIVGQLVRRAVPIR